MSCLNKIEKNLSDLINAGCFKEARNELEEYKKIVDSYTDTMAILEASLYLEEKKEKEAFICIQKGLLYNYKNYELYFMLGNFYMEKNKNQAYLCYENAEFYCKNEDKDDIKNVKEALFLTKEVSVVPTSIVILSYNGKDITSLCIDSLWETLPMEGYEIVIVDNASTDGSIEWLQKEQKIWEKKTGRNNLKVLYNIENQGFPAGCNQGIRLAEPKNDILLLNNDTIVPPNAIFWLRMGLYENETVGATGSISNCAGNGQSIKEEFDIAEEYYFYGVKHNIPMLYPYEKKTWLIGFSLLLKRTALEKVGYLDERFFPGNFEDTDIGLRFLKQGYTLFLCKNSFIIHLGGSSFGKNPKKYETLLATNRNKLREKYGMKIDTYYYTRKDLLKWIKEKEMPLHILDVGCGLGATIASAESMFQDSIVVGIEKNEAIVSMGKNLAHIYQGDIETMELPFEKNTFDYILLGNILEYLEKPKKVIEKLNDIVKENGQFIVDISRKIVKNGTIKEVNLEEIKNMWKEFQMITLVEEKENDFDMVLIYEKTIC